MAERSADRTRLLGDRLAGLSPAKRALLEARLLERTTRKVLVTEEGRILYDYARDILSKAEEVKAVLLERSSKQQGALS